MNELKNLMKFEFLPNEILMECFKYFNAIDIFYLFDHLNYRFFKLIRNIPLHLNCQDISKSTFNKFCEKLLTNPELKKQIYSLQLSNQNTCGQIDAFFSLNEFSHLRSLSITKLTKENVAKLSSIPELSAFHLHDSDTYNILSVIPLSRLRILTIPTLHFDYKLTLTNLTVSELTLNKLYQILIFIPMLKYLNVRKIHKNYASINDDICFNNNLKQLIIERYEDKFDEFEILVKRLPNLKKLTIIAVDNYDMIDAYRWEQLIRYSLIYLKIFNFKFDYYCDRRNQSERFVEKFEQFQSHFWEKEHRWFIEYLTSCNRALIYTIPFISDTFVLTSYTKIYSNALWNKSSVFDNVTNLTMSYEMLKNKCQHYFSQVKSFTLEYQFIDSEQVDEDMKSLKKIVNLSNLNHLDISSECKMNTCELLIKILFSVHQLSSLVINRSTFLVIINHQELCKCLNRIIKKIYLKSSYQCLFENYDVIEKFCEIFSNIEQLQCQTDQLNYLLFLLSRLSKLSILKIILPSNVNQHHFISSFHKQVYRQGIIFNMDYDIAHQKILFFWIDTNIR